MNQIRRHKIKFILLIMALVGIVFYQQITSKAVFDETKAVTYGQFTATHKVDNATLFIGTYLINLQALSDELYAKAENSAEESGQSDRYYKSELSDGAWYEISSAEGLADIVTKGTIVKEADLANLYVTYYVGADGVVKNAIDDAKVSIFDVPDPYDIYNLPELEPLKNVYDTGFVTENTGADDLKGPNKFYYNKIKDFFNVKLQDADTDECDKKLKGLNACYEQLRAQDKTQEAEILYSLMAKIDAKRRAIIFSKLSEIENYEIAKLQNSIEEKNYKSGDYDDLQFILNSDVVSAIGESLSNCQQSYNSYDALQLAAADTVLGYAEYERSLNVLDLAELGYTENLSKTLKELKFIFNIEDSNIEDKAGELAILDNGLIAKADENYAKGFTGGASGSYLEAKASGMSLTATSQILEDDKSELSSKCSELQFLIRAKTTRMDSKAALEFTNQRLNLAEGFLDKVPWDDFQNKAKETIQEHIIWLKALAKEITDSDSDLTSNMEKLEAKKNELITKKNEALDKNDLAGAKRLDAEIEAVDKNIQKEEKSILSKLGEDGNSLSDKTGLQNSLGNESAANNINQLSNNALSALMDGDISKLSQAAYGLAALGASDALNELKSKCTDPNANDILKAASEESLKNELNKGDADGDGTDVGDGDGTDAGDSDGTGTGSKTLTADSLLNLLSDLLGESFGDLDADGQIIVTCAVKFLGQDGVSAGTDLAKKLMNQCVSSKNRYAYKIPEGQAGNEYLALTTVAKATGYRYVYSDSLKEATLTFRGKTYSFTVGTKDAVLPDKSKEQMPGAVVLKTSPYIIESAGSKYFDCEAEYVDGTGYSACMTSDMMDKAKELSQDIKDSMEE